MSDEMTVHDASPQELNVRVNIIEREVDTMRSSFSSEIMMVRGDYEKVLEKHSGILERVADKIETALNYQRDSLPINLVMKLFTFFSVLIIGLLSAVLGIKWVSAEIFQPDLKPGAVQEQPR